MKAGAQAQAVCDPSRMQAVLLGRIQAQAASQVQVGSRPGRQAAKHSCITPSNPSSPFFSQNTPTGAAAVQPWRTQAAHPPWCVVTRHNHIPERHVARGRPRAPHSQAPHGAYRVHTHAPGATCKAHTHNTHTKMLNSLLRLLNSLLRLLNTHGWGHTRQAIHRSTRHDTRR